MKKVFLDNKKGRLKGAPFFIFEPACPSASLWVRDGRMDQDHGMNQEAKDERIKQEYIRIEKFGLNLKEGDDSLFPRKHLGPEI